ncbi:hypothetical protein IWW56_001649 [Coemansia sp. RSA 2131]|nr:hypothetical protein IWW56_001649 [Coemansia sp. RSA 2131]
MGAVESVQTTSFHEFRLFGRSGSSDSVLGKTLKSASVCLTDPIVPIERHSCAESQKLRETASMPHLPSTIEQLREDTEPKERRGLAAAFQRLAKLARVKRSQRRHSSGECVVRNTAKSAYKRPKSLPDLSLCAAEWSGSEPRRLEIEWAGSEPHPSMQEPEPNASVEDEAVADYMYLTACPDAHDARVRWWPRRLVPVQSMQFMPRLDELMDGRWGMDYWDVLSRCPMRPTSSLALASLREMVEPGEPTSSVSSSSSSNDENRLPMRNRARPKRVLSEPMQYILYNSYLRYYGPPDKQ